MTSDRAGRSMQKCLVAGLPRTDWYALASLSNPGSSALRCFGGGWPFLGELPACERCLASASLPALVRVSIPLLPQLTNTLVQESGSLLCSGTCTPGVSQQGASALTFLCLGFLNWKKQASNCEDYGGALCRVSADFMSGFELVEGIMTHSYRRSDLL